MQIIVGNAVLELVEGDIADQDTDAVVTAAHWKLHGGDGTDGAIHSKGGPTILEECQRIGSCPMGGAVITRAGDLKARYVIHAVGPIYLGDADRDASLLRSAYQESLHLAVEHRLRTISFPSISTGAFGYPMQLAAPVAIRAICDFLRSTPHELELIRIVLFSENDPHAHRIYGEALQKVAGGIDEVAAPRS